jgi:hypothetical protein
MFTVKEFAIYRYTVWGKQKLVFFLERPPRYVLSNLYNILHTVNTQHTSRQAAIITIRLHLTTCFGRDRPSSGQLRTTIKVQ